MTALNTRYERAAQVMEEMSEIRDEEVAKETRTPSGNFDHLEWLDEEFKELQDERARLFETVTPRGEFVGLKRNS